jgi:hypothetical protein
MIYYIYVHTHESICPIPFVIATDFQKIRWSNSTPFVCALKHNGFAYLGAQDGSVNHCFLVSDVVILEKCWRESNAAKLLERFSKDHDSNGRSMVKKLRSILAPVIKRHLREFIQAPILALKPAPTRATSKLLPTAVEVQTARQKNLITPFSLEAAYTLVAPSSRQINIIPDDGSCFWCSHIKDPKSAVVGRLADKYRSEDRDQVLEYIKDTKVLDETKENILIGLMDSLNEHRRTERHHLPPLTDLAEVSKEWSLRILESDFYQGQIEGQILAGIQARKNGERTTHVTRWNDATARIDVTQCNIDKMGSQSQEVNEQSI